LTALAASKAALRQRITRHREECARAAGRIAQPLQWLDSVADRWRHLSPLLKAVALPLGVLLNRAVAPRPGVISTLLRWGPLALGAVRGLRHRAGRD
jgi:hypothetical protein